MAPLGNARYNLLEFPFHAHPIHLRVSNHALQSIQQPTMQLPQPDGPWFIKT